MTSTAGRPFVATLRRLLSEPAPTAGQRCELCHAALPTEHRHVVDITTRRVLCACEICRTGDGRYRVVPTRHARLPETAVSAAQWDALAIPVGLAFFFFNSGLGRIVACYPGPGGAAESLLPLDAWPAIADTNPWIQSLVPDVEAFLVRRVGDEYEGFIVPIDACYELVGRIRGTWTGFRGGEAAHAAIDEFFAAVVTKCSAALDATKGDDGHVKERP